MTNPEVLPEAPVMRMVGMFGEFVGTANERVANCLWRCISVSVYAGRELTARPGDLACELLYW